jgi:hypothetical protein
MNYQGSCHCDPKGNRMAAVNARRLEGVELAAIPVQHFDGRAL